MLNLMQMQEETQKQLEHSLQQLELHNIQLDNVAKMDELTRVLNRRGFEIQAEKVVVHAVIDSRRNLQDILVAKLLRL